MTDGTSQGLFIVVAIVIFGIFVVLAYILFEDTLSPTLANMFTTATEQASERLESGYDYTDEKFFLVQDIGNNSVKITGYVGTQDGNNVRNLVIPATIGGKIVTTIGRDAFYNVGLTSVVIPKTVTKIEDGIYDESIADINEQGELRKLARRGAFGRNQITRVTFSNNLAYIPKYAFANNKLKHVDIPNGVTNVGWAAFIDNEIESFTLAKTVVELEGYAFGHNRLKGKVILPDTVKNIRRHVFSANHVDVLEVSSDIRYIDPTIFGGRTAEIVYR